MSPRPSGETAAPPSADVVVIGSGIGGLLAGALLTRMRDKRVVVLERDTALGGFIKAIHHDRWRWEFGVHYLGELAPNSVPRSIVDLATDGALNGRVCPTTSTSSITRT